ncbi:MAG: aspartate dehydrogenase [Candidatus Altiarchaeota archaeon]|nr:aspartate dehydrogenase [Candidatus Altiarchaeota archaeon]
MIKIALLGCGNIGEFIANAVYRGIIHCKLVKVFDKDKNRSKDFLKDVNLDFEVVDNIDDLIEGVDLVVEAASQEAVTEYALRILESGKSLMIMSVGALADNRLFRDMKKAAMKRNVKIYIPSGGIVGVDGLNAASLATIDSVEITTRKNPKTLGVDVKEETVIFKGAALDGVRKFPKSVNVAATLGIAGVGLDGTLLRIVADPKVDKNIHEVHVKGDFGEFTTIAKNLPSTQNPKTSWIAALSAIALLKKLTNVVHIGT